MIAFACTFHHHHHHLLLSAISEFGLLIRNSLSLQSIATTTTANNNTFSCTLFVHILYISFALTPKTTQDNSHIHTRSRTLVFNAFLARSSPVRCEF